MSKPARILITGSRHWNDLAWIERELNWAAVIFGDDAILVSGNCPTGADRMCEEFWEKHIQGVVERHPANWDVYRVEKGQKNPAGFIRNKEMVNLGADICIAFILNSSAGATHTVDLAKKAGIRTVVHTIEYKAESFN